MSKVDHYKNEYAIKKFGNRVRELRMRRNMTIEDFANTFNLHVTTLSRIERGETNTTISYIFRLAEIFGITPAELIDFKND